MRKIEGSTLHELLVTMIIIGILFLSVMEGYILVKRFCLKAAIRMEKNMDSLSSYYKYNKYTIVADTVVFNDTINEFKYYK